MRRRTAYLSLYFLVCLAPNGTLVAQTPTSTTAQDLKRLTIEELAELDVTSVSRRVERVSETAAAVSIIRQDDIRRTGVVSLAEAMRLADGVDVARYDGRTWAVSTRGFNISTANKLLVLMDGRTLYSPLFSGTFWDVQDTLLDDIDRIEVIRGPGGTIWGANAVNGVINVITKDASTTRGNTALLAVGSEERLIASARHGGRLGSTGNYRVFGKYRIRDANVFSTGEPAGDEMQLGQGGFRLDSNDEGATRWTLQGDAYRGTEALFDRDDTDVAGGNVLGRWVKRYAARSELQVQVYYDRTYRKVPRQFEETRDTFDVDVQRRLQFRARQDIVFGGAFRASTGRDVGSAGFVFDPQRQTDKRFSFFAQDEIELKPGSVFLTVGSKFERNDFTGLEVQPTLRSRWIPSDRQSSLGPVILLDNTLNAVTSGFGAAGTVQVLEAWRVHAWWSYLHKDLSPDAGSRDISRGRDEGNDPSFLFSIRSYLDLPRGLALDGLFPRVDNRPFPAVPAYSELDLRLGWTLRPGWEVSLVGQNLLHDRHPELGSNQAVRYEFQRGVYVRSAWRF